MTPVQLPEVPAREVVAHHIHGTEAEVLAFRLDIRNLLPGDLIGQSVHVLTAAQLREYATEAVMAERRRLMGLVAEWRTEDMPGETVAFWLVADQLEERITPSETNSER